MQSKQIEEFSTLGFSLESDRIGPKSGTFGVTLDHFRSLLMTYTDDFYIHDHPMNNLTLLCSHKMHSDLSFLLNMMKGFNLGIKLDSHFPQKFFSIHNPFSNIFHVVFCTLQLTLSIRFNN